MSIFSMAENENQYAYFSIKKAELKEDSLAPLKPINFDGHLKVNMENNIIYNSPKNGTDFKLILLENYTDEQDDLKETQTWWIAEDMHHSWKFFLATE